jgi:hypothetical protein
MLRRALRAFLVSSLALALWTVSRPAHASPAPLCDDRGATAIAPPLALEAPEGAIERARTPVTCPGSDVPYGSTVDRGHRGMAGATTAAQPVLPASATGLVPPPGVTVDPPARFTDPPEGVRSRVERPPRA